MYTQCSEDNRLSCKEVPKFVAALHLQLQVASRWFLRYRSCHSPISAELAYESINAQTVNQKEALLSVNIKHNALIFKITVVS